MIENRKCKNKKCQRSLPEGYKHRYCENCRNEHIKLIKDIGKITLGLTVLFVGSLFVGEKNETNKKDEKDES